MDENNDLYRPFYEEVGRRVRAARLDHRPSVSQGDLGKIVGLSRTSITNLEKGRQKCLIHTLLSIANALDIDVKTLIPELQAAQPDAKPEMKNQSVAEQTWILSSIQAVEQKVADDGA